ncbi:ATP-dependent DNA helicase DinG [Halomonas elongata]|uniref:ATP-dependent DNA helicase DinG n=1 Tax=Halomonas elongata (strain ATCC 33173 / DSM 2581 / NBRC 15536 / NCIMB 2198 / 1H9) TaxID=768066 RepID=E1V4H8_HALED|nr:ATP-dependent DNA helicase DinG [Halomonas elongata]WBF16661.1 ATP-dependent DNA helicase DinG [Halomonas elongata]WPU49102.1 ATP-dependent DNA helicase DinG [Halomonas elongata DSM 2581]CBV42916.1 ATP-dependent DNA helicase DinG [Halomonas elongata DSM 2581]
MLDEVLKDEIQTAYRRVLEGLELTPRYGQRLMIAEIARTLAGIETDDAGRRTSDEHVCVLEAGTGTGKTLAYLLAALPVAKARGKRLVVATATVALQEQVLHQDLPALKAHSGLAFDYALAKGRGRYVCVARLDQAMEGGEDNPALSLFEQSLDSGGDDFQKLVQSLGEAYGNGRWQGDRDSWPEAIDDAHWRKLTVDHRQCTNRRCGHFGACAFFRARRDLDSADIIVANHDLVLADLALGGGVVLPDPGDCLYVFDEGHHLPDKAINHFTHRFAVGGGLRWLSTLKKSLSELNQQLGVQPTLARLLSGLPQAIEALEPRLGEAFSLGHQLAGRPEGLGEAEEGAQHRFEMGRVPDALRETSGALVTIFAELSRTLESMSDILRESLDPEKSTGLPREQAEPWLPLVALLHGRALEAHALWLAFAESDSADEPPRARWLTLERFGGEPELTFAASPVSAAHTLAKSLWGRCHGAVVTSATLTALGRFERLQERAGLANRYRYQRLPSPFDYSRAVLSVPREAVDPADREGHERAIVEFVEALDDKEAVLMLFSSRAQLRGVERALSRERRDRVLAQDRLPKRELVERHRERVDKGEGSILFGLASFAEGIDLPGEYLTHVVITRLPFAVPDDPVGATLAEWIESQGGNPFMRISVPDASIKLVQACGRLIRKEADVGRITLLDRRVLTRRYGRALLDALPPFTREIDGLVQD